MYFGRWLGDDWSGDWWGDGDETVVAGGYFGYRYFGATRRAVNWASIKQTVVPKVPPAPPPKAAEC
jgi:hypothetical protein